MKTGAAQKKIMAGFINDKSPILDVICNDLVAKGIEVVFCSKNIENVQSHLSALKEPPKVCIIDLDFYDKSILAKLQEFSKNHPNMKLIAHSDIDNEKVGKTLLDIGFSSYLLVGSDVDNFRKAIDKAANG